jgi:putative hydrolase of the HAD superfamily
MSSAEPRPIQGEPKGLLIDYGGVLTNPLYPILQRFCRAKGLQEDAVARLITHDGPLKPEVEAYERGELEEQEFMPRFAAHLGVTLEDMDELLVELEPDERMFRTVAQVRAQGIRTCLLSNSWGLAVYPRDLLAPVFDGIVISAEVGMRKPDLEIFLHAAQTIGVQPRRCVFVDDSPVNFPGAAEAGMTVIHHERPERTVRALESALGVALGGTG